MEKKIGIHNFNCKKFTKGEKMCKKFIRDIRNKPHSINDMPDRAQDVLRYFQVKDDLVAGVPVVEILIKMGFKIYQSDLEPDDLSAYIAVDPKFENTFGSNKITCVHVEDNIGHKRFALAHELAHYLFDFKEDEKLYYYNTYFPKKEKETLEEKRANQFAANLLMPKELFQKKYEEYKVLQSKADIVSALGKYFLVSSTAILKRLSELGIVGYDNIDI